MSSGHDLDGADHRPVSLAEVSLADLAAGLAGRV
jgi:hypothetical protein